jgi:hypothetical protein
MTWHAELWFAREGEPVGLRGLGLESCSQLVSGAQIPAEAQTSAKSADQSIKNCIRETITSQPEVQTSQPYCPLQPGTHNVRPGSQKESAQPQPITLAECLNVHGNTSDQAENASGSLANLHQGMDSPAHYRLPIISHANGEQKKRALLLLQGKVADALVDPGQDVGEVSVKIVDTNKASSTQPTICYSQPMLPHATTQRLSSGDSSPLHKLAAVNLTPEVLFSRECKPPIRPAATLPESLDHSPIPISMIGISSPMQTKAVSRSFVAGSAILCSMDDIDIAESPISQGHVVHPTICVQPVSSTDLTAFQSSIEYNKILPTTLKPFEPQAESPRHTDQPQSPIDGPTCLDDGMALTLSKSLLGVATDIAHHQNSMGFHGMDSAANSSPITRSHAEQNCAQDATPREIKRLLVPAVTPIPSGRHVSAMSTPFTHTSDFGGHSAIGFAVDSTMLFKRRMYVSMHIPWERMPLKINSK